MKCKNLFLILISLALSTQLIGQSELYPGTTILRNSGDADLGLRLSGGGPAGFFNFPGNVGLYDLDGKERLSLFGESDTDMPKIYLLGNVSFGETKSFLTIKNESSNDEWNVGLNPGDFGSDIVFNYSDGGNFTSTATITTSGIFTSSDKRLKQNITLLPSALESLMSVNATHYNRKQTPSRGEYGFIAQEIEKIYPEMVMTVNTKNGEQYMMNYSQMIPVLTKAIQEQQYLITNQNSLITDLQNRIQALEKAN